MFFLKRKYAVLPICFCCNSIFALQSLIINNRNNVELKYRCNCCFEQKIDINKYLYGLHLSSEIDNWHLSCCLFCIKCERYTLDDDYGCKHLAVTITENNYLQLCQEHYDFKKNFVCMDCQTNECKDCIVKYHHNHQSLSLREYYDNIEKNIINKYFTNVDEYILQKFQVNNQLLEQLKILYHFFLFCFKLVKDKPNYRICKSIENLTHIENSTSISNIKVIYHQKNILKFVCAQDYKCYYKSYKIKVYNEIFYFTVGQGFMLSNGNIFIKFYLFRDDSFQGSYKFVPAFSYFVLFDPFLKKKYYKSKKKDSAFAFHIKEDLYCLVGVYFCMILDLSQNKPKIINKYISADFNLIKGITFKNKILVYSKNSFYLFQMNDKLKDFKFYESKKNINNIIYYKGNQLIIVYENSFAIFDYTDRKTIISLPFRKSNFGNPYFSSFLLNKYLFVFRAVGYFSWVEVPLVFNIEKKEECSKNYFFPGQPFSFSSLYYNDTYIGVGNKGKINMFDLESGCTQTYVEYFDAQNVPSFWIKLKYGYYVHVVNFYRFVLYYGGD